MVENLGRKVIEWTTGNETFVDRNRDGFVDYWSRGNAHVRDGYTHFKIDDDFDGYFDCEFWLGGIAGEIRDEAQIHERVVRVPGILMKP